MIVDLGRILKSGVQGWKNEVMNCMHNVRTLRRPSIIIEMRYLQIYPVTDVFVLDLAQMVA